MGKYLDVHQNCIIVNLDTDMLFFFIFMHYCVLHGEVKEYWQDPVLDEESASSKSKNCQSCSPMIDVLASTWAVSILAFYILALLLILPFFIIHTSRLMRIQFPNAKHRHIKIIQGQRIQSCSKRRRFSKFEIEIQYAAKKTNRETHKDRSRKE